MAYTYARAGQIVTADLLNNIALVGQFVFKATRDTVQSIPWTTTANPAAANALIWETVELDDLGGWSVSTPTRYTVQRDGWYELAGAVGWSANATNIRTSIWFINGVGPAAGHTRTAPTSTSTQSTPARTLTVEMTVGEYVEFAPGHAITTGGGTDPLDTTTGGPRPYMTVKYLRPLD